MSPRSWSGTAGKLGPSTVPSAVPGPFLPARLRELSAASAGRCVNPQDPGWALSSGGSPRAEATSSSLRPWAPAEQTREVPSGRGGGKAGARVSAILDFAHQGNRVLCVARCTLLPPLRRSRSLLLWPKWSPSPDGWMSFLLSSNLTKRICLPVGGRLGCPHVWAAVVTAALNTCATFSVHRCSHFSRG